MRDRVGLSLGGAEAGSRGLRLRLEEELRLHAVVVGLAGQVVDALTLPVDVALDPAAARRLRPPEAGVARLFLGGKRHVRLGALVARLAGQVVDLLLAARGAL